MLSNLVFVFRRRWPILLFIPLAAVVLVVLLAPTPPKAPTRYTSTVFVAADPTAVNDIQLEQASIDIGQSQVARAAGKKLGLEGVAPSRLAKHIETDTKGTSLSISITAVEAQPKKATAFTKAFAEAFLEVDQANRNGDFASQLKEIESTRDKAKLALQEFSAQNAALLNAVPPDAGAVVSQQVLRDNVSAAEQRLSDVRSQQVKSPYRISGSVPTARVAAARAFQNRLEPVT